MPPNSDEQFPDVPSKRRWETSADTRRLSAKQIQQRVDWVHDPMVYWSGIAPASTTFPGVAFRPIIQILSRRLNGLAPGIYSVRMTPPRPWVPSEASMRNACREINPCVGSVRPVLEADIAQAARALRMALRFPLAMKALVGDLPDWHRRGEIRLRLVSRAVAAASQGAKGDLRSLELEELCCWVGSENQRPSRRIATPTLLKALRAVQDVESPGSRIACLVLGQRGVPAVGLTLPHPVWHRLGTRLSNWPPDVLARLPANEALRLVSNGGRLGWQRFNVPAAASLIQELDWAGGEASLGQVVASLPRFLSSVTKLLDLRETRWQLLRAMLEEVEQHCPLCLRTKQNTWMAPWDSANRELLKLLENRNPHRMTERPKGPSKSVWKALDLAYQEFLGVSIADHGVSFHPFQAENEAEAKARLLEKLRRIMEARVAAPHPGWMATLCGTAGRISGWTGDHALPALEQWWGTCAAEGVPGPRGDLHLKYSQHLLELWVGVSERASHHLWQTTRLLTESSGVLLSSLATGPNVQSTPKSWESRLREACWAWGRLGSLSSAQCQAVVDNLWIHPCAQVLSLRPDRLAAFVDRLLDHPPESSPSDFVATWAKWFAHPTDEVLRWTLMVFDRLRFSHRLPERELMACLAPMVSFLSESAPLQEFMLPRLRLMDELIASLPRARHRETHIPYRDEWRDTCQDLLQRVDLLRLAVGSWRKGHSDGEAVFRQLLRKREELENQKAARPDPIESWRLNDDAELEARVALAAGDPKTLWNLLRVQPSRPYTWSEVLAGWKLMAPFPTVQSFVQESLNQGKLACRTLDLLGRLGLAARLRVERMLKAGMSNWANPAPHDRHPEWTLPQAVERELALHAHYRKLSGAGPELSAGVQELLNRPQALQRELDHLKVLASRTPPTRPVARRIENLQGLLGDRNRLEHYTARELSKALRKQQPQLRLAALQSLVENAIREHWRTALGSDAPLRLTPNWDNALRLLEVVKRNKVLLRRLLRHEAAGNRTWIREHPRNREWLERMAGLGIKTERWLGTFEWSYRMEDGTWTLYLETEPLEILQMGNLFDTCLSTGSLNDFSTIANAIEVNKRVIYLKNSQGVVIGRKLIAVVEGQGRAALIGFRSYGMGSYDGGADEASSKRPWIKVLLDLACGRIAREIGAGFAAGHDEEHALARRTALFAHWYNDGPEAFDWWATSFDVWPAVRSEPDPEQLRRAVAEQVTKTGDYAVETLRALLWLGPEALPKLLGEGLPTPPASGLSFLQASFTQKPRPAMPLHTTRARRRSARRSSKSRPSRRPEVAPASAST